MEPDPLAMAEAKRRLSQLKMGVVIASVAAFGVLTASIAVEVGASPAGNQPGDSTPADASGNGSGNLSNDQGNTGDFQPPAFGAPQLQAPRIVTAQS